MRIQHPARERENDAAREDATAEVSDEITTDSKNVSVKQKRRNLQQTGGFLPALLAPLAASVVIPLLRELFA